MNTIIRDVINLFNNIVKLFSDQKIVVALHPKSKKENFYGYDYKIELQN